MGGSAQLATSASSADDPEAWVASVHCVLETGTVREAWHLAEEGAAKFPGHEELDRLSRVLAPPRVVSVPGKNAPDMTKAFERLEEESWRFRRQWVALSADGIVASADTLDDLLARVRSLELEGDPLVHFIGSGPLEIAAAFAEDPESWSATAKHCLEEGAFRDAQRLSFEGALRFPGHQELERMSRLLSPPKKVRRSGRNLPDRSRAVQRLRQEISELRGKWVALSEDDVVAKAETLKELNAAVQPMDLEHPPLVSYIA